MDKKQVHCYMFTAKINDKIIWKIKANWTYSIPKMQENLKYTDFDTFIKNMKENNLFKGDIIEKKKFFSKEKEITYKVQINKVWDTYEKISKKNFISAQIIKTINIINYDFSITDLANKLPAAEFIDYLKDNGIDNIALTKE